MIFYHKGIILLDRLLQEVAFIQAVYFGAIDMK